MIEWQNLLKYLNLNHLAIFFYQKIYQRYFIHLEINLSGNK